jgi:hypothetical protein
MGSDRVDGLHQRAWLDGLEGVRHCCDVGGLRLSRACDGEGEVNFRKRAACVVEVDTMGHPFDPSRIHARLAEQNDLTPIITR